MFFFFGNLETARCRRMFYDFGGGVQSEKISNIMEIKIADDSRMILANI
jgi:hypothetical protein